MPLNYRRPGVYLEESLLSSAGDVSNATSVAVFVGASSKGPVNEPVRIETWGDYTALFGGFDTITDPQTAGVKALSYLPYSVYSYFQNGGRTAYVVRAIPTAFAGTAASKIHPGTAFTTPFGATSGGAFTISARSAGTWGTNLKYTVRIQETIGASPITDVIFTLQVILNTNGVDEVVESYPNLSVAGTVSGTRSISEAVNDAASGSRYITVSAVNNTSNPGPDALTPIPLQGGTDPRLPSAGDLSTAAIDATNKVEGPVLLNIAGYTKDVTKIDTSVWDQNFVGATVASSSFSDRQDIFIINDNCPPRIPGQTTSSYKSTMSGSTALAANTGDSYSASYGPWGLITNPLRVGSIMAIPPGGAVMGMMGRIDATIGVFRAPAGVIATLNNFVGVSAKFTDSELGDLNSSNINVIRPVVGAGLAVMGARTRKAYGADRYVSARRTLIFIREVMRRSTQFAVFENNDNQLWSSLTMAAERILRPLWESGGLRGSSASEAYFIRCDETVNTPAVIAAGEVRMEVGVALEYPAEFVIIRVSQFDRGQTTTEVNPR